MDDTVSHQVSDSQINQDNTINVWKRRGRKDATVYASQGVAWLGVISIGDDIVCYNVCIYFYYSGFLLPPTYIRSLSFSPPFSPSVAREIRV